MKTELIAKEENVVKFTITFEAKEFEAAADKAYKDNRKYFSVDGFRKGKAPRRIIENYYGQDVFNEEAVNNMLEKGYPEAIKEMDLEVVAQPQLAMPTIKKGEDVVVEGSVEVFPEVEVKNYKGLKIEEVATKIGAKEVNEELERVQKSQARMESVEDRAAENGDTVIIDFKGSIDGVEFKGGSGENFELKLGSGQFIPGFEDQLVGKESGAEVNVEVTFPEDYHAEDLAGKAAVFETKIHEIKKEVLPAIDDELASDVSDFETLAEYKKDLKVELQKKADERDESIMKDRVLEKLYEENEIEASRAMVNSELDNMIYDMKQNLQYQGITFEQYCQWLGKTEAEMKEESRPEAAKRVKTRVLLKNVIRLENIKATDEEVEKEMEAFGANYGQTVDQVKEMVGEDNLKYFAEDVETKKAIDFLLAQAKKTKAKAEKKDDDKAEKKPAAKKTTAKKTTKKAEDK